MRSVKISRDATNASGLRSYTHGTVASERVGAFSIARYDGIYLVRWFAPIGPSTLQLHRPRARASTACPCHHVGLGVTSDRTEQNGAHAPKHEGQQDKNVYSQIVRSAISSQLSPSHSEPCRRCALADHSFSMYSLLNTPSPGCPSTQTQPLIPGSAFPLCGTAAATTAIPGATRCAFGRLVHRVYVCAGSGAALCRLRGCGCCRLLPRFLHSLCPLLRPSRSVTAVFPSLCRHHALSDLVERRP
jgi:hypothetical protein